jgi:hypothetical protein
VPHATVATQVHETLDVHGQGATQIAFHGVLCHLTADSFYFGLGKILDLGFRLYATGVADSPSRGATDSVNRCQRDDRVLLCWNVNPGYSSHESYLLNGTNRLRATKPARIPNSVLFFNSKTTIRKNNDSRSTLSLLVTAILADDADHALATDNLTVATNAFYRGTYFHGFTYLSSGLPQ